MRNNTRQIAGLFLFCLTSFVFADDWPCWRGPDGTGISAEKDWDPLAVNEQNKPLWTAQVGQGFSAVTVVDGKAVTIGNVNKDTDVIYCFDANTGKELWTHKYAEPLGAKWYDGGTHCTPTIADGKVYTLSKLGKAFCLSLADGKIIWQAEIKMKTPEWGFSGSPVIAGDSIIYNISDHGMALNKNTGEKIWAGEDKASGYSTAVIQKSTPTLAYLFNGEQLNCVNVADGSVVWSYLWKTSYGVNAADPIVIGQEIFITSGYGHGCSLLRIEQNQPAKVWENKNMRSKMSGPVFIDGYLYGIDEGKSTELVCLDWKTGEKKWSEPSVGMGSLMAADGKLIVIGEKGKLMIAKASPEKFELISSAQVVDGYCWTMPTLANGKIYVRNAAGKLVCIDVASQKIVQLAEMSGKATLPSWPQWQGPKRNNISQETGLLKSWPADGPKMLWSCDGLGKGYSTVSITEGKIYTTGMIDKTGFLFCIDWAGKLLWKQSYGPEWTGSFPGVRCTPTIDNDKIYLISGKGIVSCLNAADGKMIWWKNIAETFGGKVPRWGYAESSLIVENKVFFIVGGEKALVVALDKNTGEVVWTNDAVKDEASYCSPLAIESTGQTTITFYAGNYIVGVNAADGKTLWTYDLRNMGGRAWRINTNTPVYADGMLFFNTGYDLGAVMLKLGANGASQEWINRDFDTHHGSVVHVGDYLYGTSWKGNENGDWMCVEWKTGKTMYQTTWVGKGSLTCADGMLYCYEEKNGTVALVKADPGEFKPISTFKITLGNGEHWAHPVICGKRLFIRHGDTLMAFDIAAN